MTRGCVAAHLNLWYIGVDTSAEQIAANEAQLASLRTAKERMINSNLRLVVKIAKQYANKGLGLQDLIQEGTLGLITAVDKFDPSHASQVEW